MSCGCQTYECLEAWVNPCNTGTSIGLIADSSGDRSMRIEFNGAWKEFGISVTEDEPITILTSLLNESYVHELRMYDDNGAKIGCYKLQTHYTADVADVPIPPLSNNIWDWHSEIASGNTLTSDYLTGDLSPIIWLDSNPLEWANAGITHDPETGTLDLTAIGGYSGTISYQYRNLQV